MEIVNDHHSRARNLGKLGDEISVLRLASTEEESVTANAQIFEGLLYRGGFTDTGRAFDYNAATGGSQGDEQLLIFYGTDECVNRQPRQLKHILQFWMRHSLSSRDALPEMTLIARVLEVERIVSEIPNGP